MITKSTSPRKSSRNGNKGNKRNTSINQRAVSLRFCDQKKKKKAHQSLFFCLPSDSGGVESRKLNRRNYFHLSLPHKHKYELINYCTASVVLEWLTRAVLSNRSCQEEYIPPLNAGAQERQVRGVCWIRTAPSCSAWAVQSPSDGSAAPSSGEETEYTRHISLLQWGDLGDKWGFCSLWKVWGNFSKLKNRVWAMRVQRIPLQRNVQLRFTQFSKKN